MYFFNEAKGIYIEEATGNAYYTTRGAARALGVSPSTITRKIQGVALEGVKKAEVKTQSGLQGVALEYCNLNPDVVKPKSFPAAGKALAALSRSLGYEIKSVVDSKYGSCNAYHRDVLKQYFSQEV